MQQLLSCSLESSVSTDSMLNNTNGLYFLPTGILPPSIFFSFFKQITYMHTCIRIIYFQDFQWYTLLEDSQHYSLLTSGKTQVTSYKAPWLWALSYTDMQCSSGLPTLRRLTSWWHYHPGARVQSFWLSRGKRQYQDVLKKWTEGQMKPWPTVQQLRLLDPLDVSNTFCHKSQEGSDFPFIAGFIIEMNMLKKCAVFSHFWCVYSCF